MKIIQQGDMKKLHNTKRFTCNNCGCIFEADDTEYHTDQQYNQEYYYIDCPFCHRPVYARS